MKKEIEIWYSVNGFESLYEISSFLRVKRLSRIVDRTNSPMLVKEKILSTTLRNGYLSVALRLNNKTHSKYIHRILSEIFLPNHKNKPCVNHIDGNKLNNSIENLEWCTYEENNQHAFKIGLQKKGKEHHFYNKKGNNCHNSKKLIDNATGIIYNSITEASESIGFSRSHLSAMIKGTKINKTTMEYYQPIVKPSLPLHK